ncbi:MAG: M24 family metallopeptidase [Candidatus Aminicenantes bacterium]|nr:M24 family metallopeptidase [Candidatus Aminicenantes bacterium]
MRRPLLLFTTLCLFLVLDLAAQFGYRYTNPELRDLIRKSKLDEHLVPIMEEYGVDCWVTLTRDPCDDMTNVIWERDIQLDPIVEYIGGEEVKVPAAFIFTVSGERIALVAESEAKAVGDTGIYKKVLKYTYNREKGHSEFLESLGRVLRELNPKTIGLNFSEDEGVADGLSYGMKRMFDRAVGEELAARVVPAEMVIVSLWNRKVAAEIQLIEKSSRKSAEITIETLRLIKPGVTTARGIFDHIRKRMKEEGMGPGWQEWWCPTVTVSAFRLGRPPSDKVIEHGDLVVINSGFLIEGHMSDLNKAAYILREGEKEPPELIRRLFATGLEATRAAVAKIKPGATGYEVDLAAREVVKKAGFPEYPHATGHTTGVWVHGLGAILGPPWKAYGEKIRMKIHENDIYAVEPSLGVYSDAHGGNLRMHFQEMVIVEKDGARYLTPPLTELILIR